MTDLGRKYADATQLLPAVEEKEEKMNLKEELCVAPPPPLRDWAALEFEAHRSQYKSIRYSSKPLKEQLELARQEWIYRFLKDDGKCLQSWLQQMCHSLGHLTNRTAAHVSFSLRMEICL